MSFDEGEEEDLFKVGRRDGIHMSNWRLCHEGDFSPLLSKRDIKEGKIHLSKSVAYKKRT